MTAENWSAPRGESKYIACAEIFSRINMVFSSKDGVHGYKYDQIAVQSVRIPVSATRLVDRCIT